MIKVVIVEDEKNICTLIINLINWIPGELELAGTAQNGVEGFEKILELQPDLVITDIRMPGMTGLELIEKVKACHLDPMFIIISGHKEFEYARNAIRFGVEDYLLKPIKRDELNMTLNKILVKHKERLDHISQESDLNTQLAQSLQTIRRDHLFRYFYLSDHTMPDRLENLLEGQAFAFQDGIYQTMLVNMDYLDPALREDTSSNPALETLCDGVRAYLADHTFDCDFALQETSASFILNYAPTSDLMSRMGNELSERARKHEYKYDCLKFCFALGLQVQHLDELEKSTITARYAMNHRLDDHSVSFIPYATLPPADLNTQLAMNEKDKSDFVKLVSALNQNGLDTWLGEYFQRFCQPDNSLLHLLYAECFQLVLLMRQTLLTAGLIAPEAFSLSEEQLLNRFNCTRDSKYLIQLATQFIETQIEGIAQSKDLQEIRPIKHCKQYINDHYSEQITLESMARELYLNPVYLGALFKSKTGISFTNWLLTVRIEKAKELLKTTQLSIYEIAERVGYQDAKHFSRLFAKHEGIKPNEYRKLYA